MSCARKLGAMQANLYALGAIALWASLASLGVSLTHIPPFLLTGIALIIGSVPAWPFVLRDPSQWRIPLRTLALGVYGLFAYHFLLFIALRHAPPVEANLVNYLWPLFIVVLSPVVLPGVALRLPHVLAALLGFGGAAIAIAGGRELSGTLAWGYLPALAAAFIWATYSLMTKRVAAFPTTAIGLFGLGSGVLSLLCHVVLEPAVALQPRDWALLAVLGLGPLGASFFMWDKALKLGDARHIGILSYITPLASTALLIVVSGRSFSWSIALATVMIISAAVMGMRAR
jgi:drug/metabolite transporter (DMT)-like permease